MKKFLTITSLGIVLGMVLSGCSKKGGNEAAGTPDPVVSTPMSAGSGPAVELKMKWAVGKKYTEHTEMNQDNKMSASGQSMDQTMTMGSDYSIAVPKELTSGGYSLDLEFLGQKLESAMAGQIAASFDSAADPTNDASNPIAPTFRKIIGTHVQYETAANGRVQNVLGLDDLVERLGGNTPQGAMIKSMLNEGTLKQYADLGRGLPDHPVRIGETWPITNNVPMGQMGGLTISLIYTFTGWDDHDGHKCAKLDYTGTIKSGANPTGAKLPYTINSGTMTGTTWFDPEAGTVIENTTSQKIAMKITPAPNQTMDSVVSQTADLKLIGVTDIK